MKRVIRLALLFCIAPAFAYGRVSLPNEFVQSARGYFQQGGIVLMWLQPGVSLRKDGDRVPTHDGFAVIGFGRDAPLETTLRFGRNGRDIAQITLPLRERNYNIQHIEGVAPKFVSPHPKTYPRLRRESALKRAARRDISYRSWIADGFQWPVRGRVSGVYGSQRFYNGEPRRPHFGVDIAAPKGTPVYATAKGRVTLAEKDMYWEGGLVFIDHGLGVTSVYMHLSKIHARVGDVVMRDDMIGEVGSAGRSTGPHLDWRVFWQNQRLDPALLVGDMSVK